MRKQSTGPTRAIDRETKTVDVQLEEAIIRAYVHLHKKKETHALIKDVLSIIGEVQFKRPKDVSKYK